MLWISTTLIQLHIFKALPDGLQKIFTMNHATTVKFLCTQREQILKPVSARH